LLMVLCKLCHCFNNVVVEEEIDNIFTEVTNVERIERYKAKS
jgi:hypothetical protein